MSLASIASEGSEMDSIARIVDSVMPKTASAGDRAALARMMKRTSLDPVMKEIYPVLFGGRLSIVIGIGGWRRMARETGRYISGKATFSEDGSGLCCTYTVTTTDGAFEFCCWLSEFVQPSPIWKKAPRHMLRIKAEVHCLQAAFGLSGPTEYDEDESVAVDDKTDSMNRALKKLFSLPLAIDRVSCDPSQAVSITPAQEASSNGNDHPRDT